MTKLATLTTVRGCFLPFLWRLLHVVVCGGVVCADQLLVAHLQNKFRSVKSGFLHVGTNKYWTKSVPVKLGFLVASENAFWILVPSGKTRIPL